MNLTADQLACLLTAHHNTKGKSKISGTPNPEEGVLRSMRLIEPHKLGVGYTQTTALGDAVVETALKAIKDLK